MRDIDKQTRDAIWAYSKALHGVVDCVRKLSAILAKVDAMEYEMLQHVREVASKQMDAEEMESEVTHD